MNEALAGIVILSGLNFFLLVLVLYKLDQLFLRAPSTLPTLPAPSAREDHIDDQDVRGHVPSVGPFVVGGPLAADEPHA